MWIYVFMFLSLVAGTFTGMFCTLILLDSDRRVHKIRKKKRKQPRKMDFPEPAESEISDEPELPATPLTRKIPPKEFSIAEFNCMADGVDAVSHVASQQQHQDDAYNTLKHRTEK
ncbi:MAG: hypothetical protein LBI03_06855 [Clostridiales bacterium]|jgi:hypothetical protein|nr:hypothetical protein [Clostridiales bacterium]